MENKVPYMLVQNIPEIFSPCNLDVVQRICQFPLKLFMQLIFHVGMRKNPYGNRICKVIQRLLPFFLVLKVAICSCAEGMFSSEIILTFSM